MKTLLLITLLLSFTHAENLKNGKKQYMKSCKGCHGKGDRGANLRTMYEWEKLFTINAKGMVDLHNNTKANKYFESNKFKKHALDLKTFLKMYASDSGNVPSC